MGRNITELDIEKKIEHQEIVVSCTEDLLINEKEMLYSLKLIKEYIFKNKYIPLKLKDLNNTEKVNYYALPLKLEYKFHSDCIKEAKRGIKVDCYNLGNVLDDFINFVCECKGYKIGVGCHLIEKYLCSREFY